MYRLLCSIALVAAVSAAPPVKLTPDGARIHVEIDGAPFGDWYGGSDVSKPYFAPLRSASGKIVTRQYPMLELPGETRDHQHQRSLWLGYFDVNGFNFWENEFSYHKANAGRMVARDVAVTKGAIHAVIDWLGPAGQKVLTENRTMTFRGDQVLRIVDFDAALTAVVQCVFADDKDGAFAVRVADQLTEKTGNGVITSSEGGHGMDRVWGKRARWVDYSGTLDGESLGIVIFDHPESFHHPARWHARDYGLLGANPFADHAYDPALPARSTTLEPGKSLHLRYRVVVHPKLDAAAIEKLYEDWTGGAQ